MFITFAHLLSIPPYFHGSDVRVQAEHG